MKILLIMPKFFDYPELIIEELNHMGYEVDFFDDRPSTNALVKAVIRINKSLIQFYIKKYFNEIMKTVREKKYDNVFLISGQSLSFSVKMIARIKECQPQARFILYQWDSQSNFPYIKRFQHFFDKCYSFDRKDAKENSFLQFLPLFYSKVYEDFGKKKNKDFKYDFCFVGTAHPKKYKFINMISKQLKPVYPKQFIYYFLPSPIVYFYRKLVSKEFRKAKYKEFNFKPLNGKHMSDIYEASKCVLDSAQDGQVGLTIRVIEALGAKKKIITTNEDIINYDFYCPENIYIYKGFLDLDNVFFNKEYKEINREIYEKYSLRSWLKKIMEE